MVFNTSGHVFAKEIITLNVKWYLSYKLSYRDLKDMAKDRGLSINPSTINRWVLKFTPGFEKAARTQKKPVNSSWRMDETYIKVNGEWKYLYRAVDKEGNTVDYLLRAKRDRKAAAAFFKKAIGSSGVPEKINIDKSGSNTSGINECNKIYETNIEIRQNKYLNNLIEQDHRHIKQLCRATLGFQSFRSARITIAGFEVMRMLKKKQFAAGADAPAMDFCDLIK